MNLLYQLPRMPFKRVIQLTAVCIHQKRFVAISVVDMKCPVWFQIRFLSVAQFWSPDRICFLIMPKLVS